jgi:hypothetical protein
MNLKKQKSSFKNERAFLIYNMEENYISSNAVR